MLNFIIVAITLAMLIIAYLTYKMTILVEKELANIWQSLREMLIVIRRIEQKTSNIEE